MIILNLLIVCFRPINNDSATIKWPILNSEIVLILETLRADLYVSPWPACTSKPTLFAKREDFFKEYEYIYQEKPIRTATIPYDVIGIISFIIENKLSLGESYDLLNNSNIKFDGIDGKFFFIKNSIFRELNILKIENGSAVKIN